MKLRPVPKITLILILPFLTVCNGPQRDSPKMAESQPVAVETPNPSIEVAWFSVNKTLLVVRFLAPITNPSDRPIEGLVTEWIAYDSDDAIVGTFKAKHGTIPAKSTLPYVGGAGGPSLSGLPARVTVRITDPGRFSDGNGLKFSVSDVAFKKNILGTYTVTAKAMASEDVSSAQMVGFIVLKDEAGGVVGADNWRATNLPETVPVNVKFAVSAFFLLETKGKPATAEVVIVSVPPALP